MKMSNTVATILFVVAIVLLIGSIYLILDRGIAPLTGKVTFAADQPTLAAVPTFGAVNTGSGNSSNTVQNGAAPQAGNSAAAQPQGVTAISNAANNVPPPGQSD